MLEQLLEITTLDIAMSAEDEDRRRKSHLIDMGSRLGAVNRIVQETLEANRT